MGGGIYRFDTIKVRMQTAPVSQFAGPLDCLLKTVRHEGARGVYKGATPPLVGMFPFAIPRCLPFLASIANAGLIS